ncbi:MAG: hypothetical protein IJW19_00655 [Clostridia bacterium]|nr:hypothetical protein [Clostridia bacterium]
MAEIISKVSGKIKSAANVTVKKTKSAAAIAKYTVQLKTLSSELSKCYKKLGRALYEQIRYDKEMDEAIALRVSEADDLCAEIERVKAEIEKEKAELSRKKDDTIEGEFQVVETEDGVLPE